jgi:hypothetical protein
VLATRVEMEKVALVPTRGEVPKAVAASMKVMVPVEPAGALAVRVTVF